MDERPIKPIKSKYCYPTESNNTNERVKYSRDDKKEFLKKRKVYDPKESILKEKEQKYKTQLDVKLNSSPPKIERPQMQKLKNINDNSSFANMDHNKRVEKITQILKMNKK